MNTFYKILLNIISGLKEQISKLKMINEVERIALLSITKNRMLLKESPFYNETLFLRMKLSISMSYEALPVALEVTRFRAISSS